MATRKSAPPASAVAHAAAASHLPRRGMRHVELDGGDAFTSDYRHGFTPIADDDAEASGEEFIAAATSAEPVAETARDEIAADELDGLALEQLQESDE